MVKHHIRGSCLQANLDRIRLPSWGLRWGHMGGQGQHFTGWASVCSERNADRKRSFRLMSLLSPSGCSKTPSFCHRTPWCWDPGSGQAAASDTPASPPPVHHRISFREYTVSSYHVRPQKTHSDEHTSPRPWHHSSVNLKSSQREQLVQLEDSHITIRGSLFWEDFFPIFLEEEMTILDSSYYTPGGILNTYMHIQDVHESSLQEIFCSGSICLNKITGCFKKA